MLRSCGSFLVLLSSPGHSRNNCFLRLLISFSRPNVVNVTTTLTQTAKMSGSNQNGSTSVHNIDLPHPLTQPTCLPFFSVLAFTQPDSRHKSAVLGSDREGFTVHDETDGWTQKTAKVKQIGTETKETDQRSRRFAVWLLDSSVQVSWAVRARLREPHSSREWGENSAVTDFESKSFCYKRRKIKTNLTKCIVLV